MRTTDSKNLTDSARSVADGIARAIYAVANSADRYFAARGLDRIFFHSLRLERKAPVFHVTTTQEILEPYRYSSTLVAHLPFTRKAVAFGIWSETGRDEQEALLRAVTDPGKQPEQADLSEFDDIETFKPEEKTGLRNSATGYRIVDDVPGDWGY